MTIAEWLAANTGPLAVRISTGRPAVRLYSAAGETFTAAGVEEGLSMFAALDDRPVYSEDAAQMDSDHREFLLALGNPRIRNGRVLDQALAPLKDKMMPAAGAPLAVLMQAHSAASSAAKRISRQVESEDQLWRDVARRGYLIDRFALQEQRQIRHRELDLVKREIGVDIRVSNWKKSEFLDRIGVGYTRTGEYGWALPGKCDITNMPEASADAWARYVKAHSTLKRVQILDGLVEKITPAGRVHPVWRTNFAATGRMSGRAPGLMSVMKELRFLFLAEPGHDVVSVDHSNQEGRVLARLIGSKAFTRSVLDGDPYADLAAFTGQDRKTEKVRFIAFLYGQKEATLAKTAGAAQAAATHAGMRRLFPDVVEFCAEQTERSRRGEVLTTLWGRPLPVLDGRTYETRHAIATNLQVQSSARDAYGAAVRATVASMGAESLFIPLHDELFTLAPTGRTAEYAEMLLAAMTVDLGEGVILTSKAKVSFGRWAQPNR
ncbi:DNA polymerase [Cryobacterium sp. 10I5]|uniref:DNA polymerase n=1 Tax=Cryobacterium sp. 10I5 TaxID=3048581 RepID=UPI002B2330F2|nr:DNA polymerase [Cryobacterium sp. 10I5]MEB0265485.1 DNA polymerase [Cryobacterium sp. 10I5]